MCVSMHNNRHFTTDIINHKLVIFHDNSTVSSNTSLADTQQVLNVGTTTIKVSDIL